MMQSSRVQLQRKPQRGSYRQEDLYAILDATFLCHVAFTVEGEARVLPTAFVRIDDGIYLHGHRQNGMLNALLSGQMACVTATLLDGLVLARSGFHHSVNYRSVVLYGRPEEVKSGEKTTVLNALIDQMVPGRAAELRSPGDQELNATLVIKIPIEEASVKIRTGPPVDGEADYKTDIWAGVVNLKQVVTSIEDCPRLRSIIQRPAYLVEYSGAPDRNRCGPSEHRS